MGFSRATWLTLAVAVVMCAQLISGAPMHKKATKKSKHAQPEVAKDESAHTKSYIDIDASDPFKVPKSSQYIDQPVPEFSRGAKEKEEQEEAEDKGPPPKSIDNIQDDLKHLGLENVGKENAANDNGPKNNNGPDIPEDSPASENAPDEGPHSQQGGGEEEPPTQEGENAAGIKPVEVDMSNNIDPNTLKSGDTRHNVPDGNNGDDGPQGDQQDGDQEGRD